MQKIEKFLNKYGWLLVFLLAIPAVLSLLVPGYFGASDDMHPAWLYEMDRVIKAGIFPPRFVPDLSFGFGYPLFNFVSPLPFYLGEAFHLLGFSFVDSTKAVLFLGIPLSVTFMFFFLKRFMKSSLSLAGALIYGYLPYRSAEIFVRGDIGEAFSFVFFPLISLAVLELAQRASKNRWRYIGLGGISIALLVLTHNIAAYMFLPFASLLAVLFLIFDSGERIKRIFNLTLMFLIGLLGSIYFWLPALSQSSLMKYDTVYNFWDYFPSLRRLVTPSFGYGGYPTMSLFIGLAAFVSIIFGSFFVFFHYRKITRENKIIFFWSFIVLLVSLFMMNYRSIFVWNIIPLLPYFQFPWRFLMMIVFISPLFLIGLNNIRYRSIVALAIGIFAIVTTVSYFRPQDYLGRTDSYYLDRYIPVPVVSSQYRQQNEEYLRLPQGTEVRPDKDYPIAYSSGGEIKDVTEVTPLDSIIKTVSEQDFTLNFSKYNFPGWIVLIDGVESKIETGKPYGQITVLVPKGDHVIRIYFAETDLNRILDAISLVSIIVSLMLIFNKLTLTTKK